MRCAATLLVLTALAACTSPRNHEPTAVDIARADALLADPWLDAYDVTMTRYAYGTNDAYHPTTATVYRPALDGPAEALRDEVTQARQAGWWPFYAQCDGAADGPPDLLGAMGVVLVRELPDGSYGQAVLTVGSDAVEIIATAPNHDMEQPPLPAEADVKMVACLSPDGSGRDRVGNPVNLTRDWST